MPSLDEGSYLLMPTSMPHSGIEYNRKVVGQIDMLVGNIPEVAMVVGKLGRVESALDPAPISMYENIINYKPEFILDEDGKRVRFKVDGKDRFITLRKDTLSNKEALETGISEEDLIKDEYGEFYRNWRPHIKSPDDIWNEIVGVTKIPGVTSARNCNPLKLVLLCYKQGCARLWALRFMALI